MEKSAHPYFKYQPLLLAICAIIGMYGGYKLKLPEQKNKLSFDSNLKNYTSGQKITDALSYIDSKYVDSLKINEASDYMIQQLCLALDPYSEYIPANQVQEYMDDLDGGYHGIGLSFIKFDETWMANNVLKNSPAELGGIEPGDEILSINGHTNKEEDFSPEGLTKSNPFEVDLKWKKQGSGEVIAKKIRKENLESSTLGPVFPIDQNVFYLRLNSIGERSYREFMDKVEKYTFGQGRKSLILDLRDNSGGLLNIAADILNQLVPVRNVELFSTINREGKKKSFNSLGKPFFKLDKIIILINEHTASSAEIIAGSLQELKLAKLLGFPSFGKATVLEPFNLADGSQILLATSRILLPSGRCIQKPYYTYSKDSITNWISPFNPIADSFGRSSNKYVSAMGLSPDWVVEKDDSMIELSDDEQLQLRNIMLSNYQALKIAIAGKVENITSKETDQLLEGYLSKNNQLLINSNSLFQMKERSKFILAELLFGMNASQNLQLINDPVFARAKKEISFN